MVLANQEIHRRHDEQRKQGSDGDAGSDDQAYVKTRHGTRTGCENQRQNTQYHRRGGH